MPFHHNSKHKQESKNNSRQFYISKINGLLSYFQIQIQKDCIQFSFLLSFIWRVRATKQASPKFITLVRKV